MTISNPQACKSLTTPLVILLLITLLFFTTAFAFKIDLNPKEQSFSSPLYQSSLDLTQNQLGFDPLADHSSSLAVEPPNQQIFERYFKQLYGNGLFQGSAALYKDGKFYTAATGYIDANMTIPTTNTTRYRFASNTKLFVAVLIMKAVEEKRIALWNPLSWWFSQEMTGITTVDAISISMMLNHRSMLFNYSNSPDYALHRMSLEKVLKIVADNQKGRPQPDSCPGEYSNTNFYLLGKILEQTYGMPLQELIRVKIYKPFDMSNSDFIPLEGEITSPRYEFNEAETFIPTNGNTWTVQDPRLYSSWNDTAGAGAIISTPTDMIKFYYNTFVKQNIISNHSISLMREYKLMEGGMNYGFGLFEMKYALSDSKTHTGFGHNGVIDGTLSQISITSQGDSEDPLTNPFIIYAQISNGYNFDVANTIIGMNQYGHTGQLTIPRLSHDTTNYPKYAGTYHLLQSSSYIIDIVNVPARFTDWNESKQQFEDIDSEQLVLRIPGQGDFALADLTNPKSVIFAHSPLLVYIEFLYEGANMRITQSGVVNEFVKQ